MDNIKKDAFDKLKAIFQKLDSTENESGYDRIEEAFFSEDISYQYISGSLDEVEAKLIEGMKMEDSYGGEGMGEDYWVVWYFPNLGIWVKFSGWYQSYDGAEYEGIYLVEPREVTVTKYYTVK